MVKNRILITASGGNKIPLEITAVKKGAVAFISIKGHIHEWGKASSLEFEKTVKEIKQDGAVDAELYINSAGGSCFEANEILNIIKDNFTNVKIRVGALAASAATYFLTQFPASAKKNSQFMIHKPMMGTHGNEDEIESNLKLLKNLTADYKKAYSKKMGITEDEVEELWAKGDFWMTAQEAKKKGLIEEIEDEEEQIDAAALLQLVACGAPIIPKAENTKTKIERMELSVLAVQLGLPSTATQAEVDAKLRQVTADAAQVQGLVQAKAEQEKAAKAASVKALLDGAEKDKKITADQRPQWEQLANANLEQATAVIGSLKSIEAVSSQLNPGAAAAQTAEQAKWTYADYQQNDPEAFEKLPEEKQTALIDAYYKEN